MKNLLWIAALFAACNSSEGTKNAFAQDSTVTTEKKTGGSAAACTNMIFFQAGAEINAKSYNAAGKAQGSMHTKIKEVKEIKTRSQEDIIAVKKLLATMMAPKDKEKQADTTQKN